MSDLSQLPPESELLLYTTDDGQVKLEVRLSGETIWLGPKQMAELFQKDVRTINEHIKHVFEEAELAENLVIRNFRIVQIGSLNGRGKAFPLARTRLRATPFAGACQPRTLEAT